MPEAVTLPALFGSVSVLIVILALAFLGGAVAGYLVRDWRQGRPERGPAEIAARPRRSDSRPAPTSRAIEGLERPATRAAAPHDIGSRVSAGVEPPTVLVADDRMELLALHATYLERHGYRVLRATDGDSALALARAEHPAVIVLDHSMPGRSGLDVTRELKADPATANIPILLMTAHSYGAIGATARAAGIASFMTKPCQPSRVLREVAAFAPPGRIGSNPHPSA